MPKSDSNHFDNYSDQTFTKHQILKSYLPAYITALKNRVKRFHYIDGFAGRGLYENKHPGSPIVAMNEIINVNVSGRTSVSFIEENKEFKEELSNTILNNIDIDAFFDKPYIESGSFHEHIDRLLTKSIYTGIKPVATFSFIDPCGIEGVKMADISRLLQLPYAEVLLFFNYDAVTRLLGHFTKGYSDDHVLVDLFGDTNTVKDLSKEWIDNTDSKQREILIREYYIKSLRKTSGAKYFLPFRFDAKKANKTSHYLVHCCDHCLGFKIMKQVMNRAGQQEEGNFYGKLEYLKKTDQISFEFRIDIDECKNKILNTLKKGPCKVSYFTVDWVCKPNDMYAESEYKNMLKELERDEAISVYDKNNNEPTPAGKRRKDTLGNDYWLRSN